MFENSQQLPHLDIGNDRIECFMVMLRLLTIGEMLKDEVLASFTRQIYLASSHGGHKAAVQTLRLSYSECQILALGKDSVGTWLFLRLIMGQTLICQPTHLATVNYF